ncbi:hypothetical protein HG15A2_29060 [Adhaeretor mobilis]|uniref:Carboxypeptidase regulatory-like domain-containing protein n=2 Tax=Adhaeretor mobilis TaxID=1930276 RepID=A0A517MXI6_9BACT|nr:hypothetical protein HG15A2_29060 [Adhaeretor mobilis]
MLSLALLTFIGCNSSELIPVTGQVTLDGAPVTTGRIEFFPTSGRPAAGELDEEGRYTLVAHKSEEGVSPGKYVVTVTSRTASGGPPPPPEVLGEEGEQAGSARSKEKYEPFRIKWHVPERYSHRRASGLTAEVKQDGGEIDFELVSKP